MRRFLALGCAVAAALGGARALAGETQGGAVRRPPGKTVEVVVNPWVTTDKYVDTSSIESVLKGLVKEGQTSEQKVLAFYHWYRRMLFHHRFMGGDRRDVLKVINSYGCNLCGSQAAVFVILLQKAGFKTQVVCGEGGKGFGGHTFVEVFYDGGWHCFDTMTSFCVFTRDDPPHIAGLKELAADPTLVTMAVEEKRAPAGYIYCMDHQENTVEDIPRLKKLMAFPNGKTPDFRWSTIIFAGGSLQDFWAKAPKRSRTLTTGTYGGRYTPGVTDFTLKPNEELVRLWDHIPGKYVKRASHPDFGPHHTCGYADEHDPMHFKFYEPYLKENHGHTKKCYRYFGNGWLEWRPGSFGETQAACRLENLGQEAQGVLRVQAPGPGRLTIPVKVPYAGVEIELDLKLSQKGAGSVTRVYLVEGRKRREAWKKAGDSDGTEKIVIPHTDSGLFGYELLIEGKPAEGGSVAFAPVRLRTVFQENIYALPGFFPEKNTVTVRAAKPTQLKAHEFVVAYEWEEGEDWKTPKAVTKAFTELPASFEVEAAGPKMPRMKKLVVRLAPKKK